MHAISLLLAAQARVFTPLGSSCYEFFWIFEFLADFGWFWQSLADQPNFVSRSFHVSCFMFQVRTYSLNRILAQTSFRSSHDFMSTTEQYLLSHAVHMMLMLSRKKRRTETNFPTTAEMTLPSVFAASRKEAISWHFIPVTTRIILYGMNPTYWNNRPLRCQLLLRFTS